MAQHVLDIAYFRTLFPSFADTTKFPDAQLDAQWTAATGFLGDYDGCLLNGEPLQLALNYMTAHLLQSFVLIQEGGPSATVGVVIAAHIDKIQVQMAPPPIKSAFQYWLFTTPYGRYLWGLLSMKAAGGFYIGGLPERGAFRKVAGTFWPGR